MGLDEESKSEAAAFFFQPTTSSDLQELLDGPFTPRPELNALYPSGRYSDGRWPVFYAALEVETATAEVAFHHRKRLLSENGLARPIFYSTFQCTFSGMVKDIRPLLQTWPLLISPDYEFCIGLAKESASSSLDALLAPSAQRESGTNVPIFRREPLSDPKVTGRIKLNPVKEGEKLEVEVILAE